MLRETSMKTLQEKKNNELDNIAIETFQNQIHRERNGKKPISSVIDQIEISRVGILCFILEREKAQGSSSDCPTL